MALLAKRVAEREKGAAPLSIATSLALEALCGFGEFPSDKPPVSKFNELWVNLRTLYRNCYNAIDRDTRVNVQEQHLVEALMEDMRVLISTVQLKSLGKLQVHFYACSYRGVEREFPKATWKELSTPKQVIEQKLENATLQLLLSPKYRSDEMNLREYDLKFKDRGEHTALLTHYPVDLLWRSQFRSLHLLESHTGKLKPRSEWYTKLTGGKRYTRIPFNRLTLQVFGDGNQLFSSMLPKIKNRILEIAEEDRWTPMTTDDKVKYSLNKIYDPREKTFFLELMRG